MTRILFVDDEAMILQGLRRMLRAKRADWSMEFVEGGAQALDSLEEASADVVVSDMRMPQMDGGDLLKEIHKRHPGCVRFVLSGFAERESIHRTIGPAHQYLSKPCDPQTLIDAISRVLAARAGVESEPWRRLLGGLQSLPAQPGTYDLLAEGLDEPDKPIEALGRIIANDLALTVATLKLTNSAFFSGSSRSVLPAAAATALGREALDAAFSSSAIYQRASETTTASADLENLSRRAVRRAKLAQTIAGATGCAADTVNHAICASFVAEVGQLIALTQASDAMEASPQAKLGACLLGYWGFNAEVVQAVAHQGDPRHAGSEQRAVLAVLHIAEGLRRELDEEWVDGERDAAFDQDFLKAAGLYDRLSQLRDLAQSSEREAA